MIRPQPRPTLFPYTTLFRSDRRVVAGPDTRAVVVDTEPGEEITGLRLPPGAAAELLGRPASELTDARTALAELVGARAADPGRSEEHTSELPVTPISRMPSSA